MIQLTVMDTFVKEVSGSILVIGSVWNLKEIRTPGDAYTVPVGAAMFVQQQPAGDAVAQQRFCLKDEEPHERPTHVVSWTTFDFWFTNCELHFVSVQLKIFC